MINKAFTLTELIAVIVLLGIIALIAVPIINGTIVNSKSKAYKAQVSAIESTAKKWGVENNKLLPIDENKCKVSLMELIGQGFIEDDEIIDPRNNSKMNGSVEISYSNSNKTYYYIYKETVDASVPNCIK